MKVAAIGDNCIDMYPSLNRFYPTGNAVDFAVNMQLLGMPTAVISTTGNDEYGKIMIEALTKKGIDLSHFRVGDGATAISYMELVDLERTYGDYVEGVMENVVFTDEDVDFACSCDLVHSAFWGNAQKHLPKIHAHTKVCFDYATEMNDPLVEETIPYVDYAFFSYDKRDEKIENFLKDKVAKGCTLAIATFGEEGSLVWDGKQFHTFGIFPAKVVNTIGAGDSYLAGFMYGILKGWPIVECMKKGAEVAAGVVSVFDPWVER